MHPSPQNAMEVLLDHDVRKVIVFYRKPSGSTQKLYTGCQVILKRDNIENVYRFTVKNSKHVQKFDARNVH